MANTLPVFEVPDNDFIELTGAGANGNLLHQGAKDSGKASTIVLIESAVKPSFSLFDTDRFQKNATSQRINQGDNAIPYYEAVAIWAVSVSDTQYLSVTPSA